MLRLIIAIVVYVLSELAYRLATGQQIAQLGGRDCTKFLTYLTAILLGFDTTSSIACSVLVDFAIGEMYRVK